MALHALLWTKPPTPYFRPPPIHLCVVGMVEQSKVVVWDFDPAGARPVTTKKNILAAVSDGESVGKLASYEEFGGKFKEGGHYFIKGHSLRGNSPPYIIVVNKDTMFFRSAPIALSEELKEQAEALIRPLSPLTPLSTCRNAKGFLTVEGEVIELSTIKQITKEREVFPLRNVTLQQGETRVPLCLWREAAVKVKLQIGTHIKVSHLKASTSNYGFQLQSTTFSTVEELHLEDTVGVLGVMDVEGEPGTLNMLLENGRMVLIAEDLWKTVEDHLVDPPLKVQMTLSGNTVSTIKISL